MFPYGETVTRLRATATTNPHSGEPDQPSWAAPSSLTINGCGFNPGGSVEPLQDARSEIVTTPEVYAPFGSDIRAGDRLVVRGKTYEVEGHPAEWHSPLSGWEPGMVVRLKAVDG